MTASHAEQLAAHRWLLGAEGSTWLAEADRPQGELVETAARLRRTLSAAQAHAVLETIALRRRGREKFAGAGRMFFTRVGLEQATDEWVAAYKAQRFASAGAVVDVCCGIGGDLLALAQRGATCGIDRDPLTALLAEANLRAMGREGTVFARRALLDDVRAAPAWHVDPDRRAEGRRTTHLAAHSPSVDEIEAWRSAVPQGAVKLAPATTPHNAWAAEAECEWISRAGQCRQLVVWFGNLARLPGCRAATVVTVPGESLPKARTIVGSGGGRPPTAAGVGRYVFEPDVAVLAAHLSSELAAEHHLAAVSATSAYLTGDEPVVDAALAGFRVLETMPLETRKLKSWLRARGIGRLEVKKRGLEVDPERLRRQLAVSGERAAVLLATRGTRGALAILAERIAGKL